MRHTYTWLGVLVLLVGVLGGGWYGWETGVLKGSQPQPVVAAPPEEPPQLVPPSLQGEDNGLGRPPLQETSVNLELRAWHTLHEAYLATLPTAKGEEIGSFSTSLAGHSASGRVQNILLAAQKLDGRILLPGEQLSFNGVLGDSNQPSAGWQLATVIVGKELTQGYGGGICQVSTTLYNSVLQAGLQVDERYTHSLPVGYVTPGHDATVSYPELDFKFSNTLDQPVRVKVFVQNGLVYAKLYTLPAEQL
ncbi:MAG TPA: VanW family protein [Bacilli bacterium]|nr:VanW family protein [Bacilli bacterium]